MDGSITLHPTKTILTGLLSPRLALHITYIYIYTYVYRARSEGVNGEGRDTGITGLPRVHPFTELSVLQEAGVNLFLSHNTHRLPQPPLPIAH